jgi:hypothetical protein
MPEQEFELYLSLLSRFLRLRPGQRAEIADELRDHLAERLQELTASGLPREAAIRQALEELGDASLLASDFTSIRTSQRRRTLMRWTVRSIAGLTAAVLLTFALWPVPNQIAPAPATAQPAEAPDTASGGFALPGPDDLVPDPQAVTEEKLATVLPKLELEQVPFADALDHIADVTATDIVIDRAYLDDNGIDLGSSVITLKIRNTPVTARTALDLILRPLKLGVTVRNGILFVGSPDDATDVQVYNCRDLLPGPWGVSTMPGAEGATSPMGAAAMPGGLPPQAMMGGLAGDMSMMGGGGMGRRGASSPEGQALIDTIMATIASDSWQGDLGGSAAISEFKGLLVIRQTQAIHREVKQLLDKLREAGGDGTMTGQPAAGSPARPPGLPGR